jgi:hypothetical protein
MINLRDRGFLGIKFNLVAYLPNKKKETHPNSTIENFLVYFTKDPCAYVSILKHIVVFLRNKSFAFVRFASFNFGSG